MVSSLQRFVPTTVLKHSKEINEAEILADLIYNSVTTLIVGEKIMIEMPTFFFPAGAGVLSRLATVYQHGSLIPMATFRFAEPVVIEPNRTSVWRCLFPQGVPGQGRHPIRTSWQVQKGQFVSGSSWTAT